MNPDPKESLPREILEELMEEGAEAFRSVLEKLLNLAMGAVKLTDLRTYSASWPLPKLDQRAYLNRMLRLRWRPCARKKKTGSCAGLSYVASTNERQLRVQSHGQRQVQVVSVRAAWMYL